MTVAMLRKFSTNLILAGILLLSSCNPMDSLSTQKVAQSTYLVEKSKLYGNDNELDLKDILVYPKADRKGPESVSTNVSNKLLTKYRCTWCHECGFTEAFDYENLGKPDWNPRFRGEGWRPVVQRMNDMDEALVNEQLAERIYTYLLEESTGIYDEEGDTAPAVRIEVDDIEDIQVLQGDVVEDGDAAGPGSDSQAGTGESSDSGAGDQPTSDN